MPKPRSLIERRFSRTTALLLLMLAAYVLGGPLIHHAAVRLLPAAEPLTRIVYAPLIQYADGKSRCPGADWYLSYWVLCDHQVAQYE